MTIIRMASTRVINGNCYACGRYGYQKGGVCNACIPKMKGSHLQGMVKLWHESDPTKYWYVKEK